MTDVAAAAAADVVVVGDGPAGCALAAACAALGIDVMLVGRNEVWPATYSVWVDELDAASFSTTCGSVMAYGDRPHRIERRYGVLSNPVTRSTMCAGVRFRPAHVESVSTGVTHHTVWMRALDSSSPGSGPGRYDAVRCRLVVDATGWPARFAAAERSRAVPAWQTAFGVVVTEPPEGDLGLPTLMDFRPTVPSPSLPAAQPSFAYALPVADGWLVEETVLAARPAVDPDDLVGRLAVRLGRSRAELLDDAVRTERVRIPMGGPAAARNQPIVAFGAAAGYVNPVSGYSVAASLRAAPRVADAIDRALRSPSDLVADQRAVWDAVWPAELRRTRALHEYGLELLVRLDASALREFFDGFFDLPVDVWSPYLRPDATPGEVTRTMRHLFRSASWPMRRRLAAGNPVPLARSLRR